MISYRRQLTKIGLLAGFVLLVGALVLSRPIGTTFANGTGLQLTIDSYSIYNGEYQPHLSWGLKDLVPGVDKFFDFDDIKPGDTGTNVISIHVEESPAYVCMDFTNLVDDENGTNEPESLVDFVPGGELSDAIEFFGWRDDGDNVFEVGERVLFGSDVQSAKDLFDTTTYPLADETTDEVFEEDETYYVGTTWCAGDLVVDVDTATITCNAEVMGNEYQTDLFSVDVSLRAVEASAYTDYNCEGEEGGPGVDLYLNKQISGDDQGFALSQFSYRVVGEGIDEVVPHDSTVRLPTGTYSIEELVPEGFVKSDWRIGWYGQCESGNAYTTSITVEDRHLDWGTLYCEADNQYRPDSDNTPDNERVDEEEEEAVEVSVDSEAENTEEDDESVSSGGRTEDRARSRTTQEWTEVSQSSGVVSRLRNR